MLLGTLRCMTLFRLVFLFFSHINSIGSQDNSILNFLRNLFSTVIAPTYIPTNSIWGFSFLHIFTNVCYFCIFLFYDSHSDWCQVIPGCGFDFHFSEDKWWWVSFYVPIGHLHFLSGKKSSQYFHPAFNLVVCFDVELYELFIYFGY